MILLVFPRVPIHCIPKNTPTRLHRPSATVHCR